MKKHLSLLLTFALILSLLCSCGSGEQRAQANAPGSVSDDAESAESAESSTAPSSDVAAASEMAPAQELDLQGLTPVSADELNEGVYSIQVDSSSSMFRIEECELTVEAGEMSAHMTMGGTGYLYLYLGTAEAAAAAGEGDCIGVEGEDGIHSFTIPVSALDQGISCAAYSKRREKWYDRTLVFRSSSLNAEAWKNGSGTAPESLGLADGEYTVEVSLSGGSGKASVNSPAQMKVEGGVCTASIVWSSPNYDYMLTAEGERLERTNSEGNSAFDVPISVFDAPMSVQADTTAMSQPYLIDYTLTFNASTITEK